MDEVGGALLVDCVDAMRGVPARPPSLAGFRGCSFRQFAVTIAASTVISCFVSLTLSPALCAVLFKSHEPHIGVAHRGRSRSVCCMRALIALIRGFDRLSFGMETSPAAWCVGSPSFSQYTSC